MADEVTRFPVSTWRRIRNQRGKRTVNCEISGRYLKYGEGHQTGTEMGVCIPVDVMTDGNDRDTPDRKICELYLRLDELKELVGPIARFVRKFSVRSYKQRTVGIT